MSAAPDQVTMTLPDGKAMTFTRGVTGAEIAAAIGPGLAKAALIIDGRRQGMGPVPPHRAGRRDPHHHQEGCRRRWS